MVRKIVIGIIIPAVAMALLALVPAQSPLEVAKKKKPPKKADETYAAVVTPQSAPVTVHF